MRPRYLERLCAEARALGRRRCTAVRSGARGGVVRAARWVRASGLDPLAIRGRAQPHSLRAARERAEPLSPRAVRERAKPLPGAARAQAVRRSGARGPAPSRLILSHHPCYDLPPPAASPLSCFPRRSPSTSGFQPHFPWKLTSLTLLFEGTWKGEGERQMTTLNTGSARFGTAVGLLKLSLPPLTCHLITPFL